MGQLARRWTSVLLSTLLVAGCGGSGSGNPNSPSPNSGGNPGGNTGQTCSSVGPLGAAKGTVTATVNGTAFNGGVSTGNSIYTPVPPQAFLPTPHDIITIVAVCGDGSQISIAARAGSWINGQFVLGAAGTTQIGVGANGNAFTDPQTQQPLNHIVQYIQVVNSVAAGGWFVSLAGGSGSITLNSVSPQAASGSFALTMIPTPGTGATGTRTVIGTFNVTF
jgi:hypothetical protein